jgi:hypothetical protein
MTDKAYAVPLHELLAGVPRNARLVIDDHDGMGTQFIPVGRMCHEASEALSSRLSQPKKEKTMDKTFAAIEKLKEVELELHRLKNALEMMNSAYDTKKEWINLTVQEREKLRDEYEDNPSGLISAVQIMLKEKNT